jgi:hypothetical protein
MSLVRRNEEGFSFVYPVFSASDAHIKTPSVNQDYLGRNMHMNVAKNVFVPFRHKEIGVMKLYESEIHFLSSD